MDILSSTHWKNTKAFNAFKTRKKTWSTTYLMNVLNVFRYLDGAVSPRPMVHDHIQIIESFTEKFYNDELLQPLDKLTYYAIVEYFLRSATLYFLNREKIMNGADEAGIEGLLENAVYLVHVLRGKISYYDVTNRKWSTEESEYIKQMYFSDGLQSIEDLVFQPIINPENKYDWCFIVPKISEKDKTDEESYIYGFYSGPEKTVTKVLTDAQGQVLLKFNLVTELLTNVLEEEKQEISLKLLTKMNKSGKACKSFNSEIRDTICQGSLREPLRAVLPVYDLYNDPTFLDWSSTVKLHKGVKRVLLTGPDRFDKWYDTLEKTSDFFEMTTRILDYYQCGNRHWFFNKYTYHYYFKRNPVSVSKKKRKLDDEESLFDDF
jgi:hypothetical protein